MKLDDSEFLWQGRTGGADAPLGGVVLTGANSYDDVPYESLAFAQTHPDRLATMARIFGLQPPSIATSRVLELGCASGGNLIPMAFNLPDAQFVGIDLSQRQIARGLETISAVGITNATLKHASILDVTREWGEFDYIICHGVFSWVERHVQDAILRIARENLAATGVAYVSYNTYPGWHMREMVRHMMRYHAGRFETPVEQIEQARALLDFLTSAAPDTEPFGQLLTREVQRLSEATDSYLYHEHLEQTNTPFYFHQFIERAERAGLQYLSEASISDMLTSVFPADVADTLERVSPDILHLEQYMDFVRNRHFRQTLLCHAGLRPVRALTPAVMHGLLASSQASPDKWPVDLSDEAPIVFWNGKQRADVSLPATKAAFALLNDAWPEAIDLDTLCAAALDRAAPYLQTSIADAPQGLMGDLFGAVMYGMVQLHTQPPRCERNSCDRPRANALAAYQARGTGRAVNVHHETVELDTFAREILRLATGGRTQRAIVDALLDRHASGDLVLEQDGTAAMGPDEARAILEVNVERTLASLARSGVLTE